MKVILASGSPRRRKLLKMIVPNYEIVISGEEENLENGLNIYEQVMKLSYMKAKNVFERTKGDRLVIGADTIVTKNGRIYGKPNDEEQAKRMLNELLEGDKIHSIITGLSVIVEKNGECKEYKTFDEVKVFFKNMTNEEVDKWIKTGKAMDKAGAYGIQDEFCVFVEKIDGNYTTAVGLPMNKLYDIIKTYINDIII